MSSTLCVQDLIHEVYKFQWGKWLMLTKKVTESKLLRIPLAHRINSEDFGWVAIINIISKKFFGQYSVNTISCNKVFYYREVSVPVLWKVIHFKRKSVQRCKNNRVYFMRRSLLISPKDKGIGWNKWRHATKLGKTIGWKKLRFKE